MTCAFDLVSHLQAQQSPSWLYIRQAGEKEGLHMFRMRCASAFKLLHEQAALQDDHTFCLYLEALMIGKDV